MVAAAEVTSIPVADTAPEPATEAAQNWVRMDAANTFAAPTMAAVGNVVVNPAAEHDPTPEIAADAIPVDIPVAVTVPVALMLAVAN
jgi:hypothetical protein